jgi:ribonuclease HI
MVMKYIEKIIKKKAFIDEEEEEPRDDFWDDDAESDDTEEEELEEPEEESEEEHEGSNKLAKIYFDGSGKGKSAIVLADEEDNELEKEILEHEKPVTSNQAEYHALIMALKKAKSLEHDEIHILGDSELVVKQMNGLYKVSDPKIFNLHQEANKLLEELKKDGKKISISYIPREKNLADRYASDRL